MTESVALTNYFTNKALPLKTEKSLKDKIIQLRQDLIKKSLIHKSENNPLYTTDIALHFFTRELDLSSRIKGNEKLLSTLLGFIKENKRDFAKLNMAYIDNVKYGEERLLTQAAQCGNIPAVKLLLKAGANIDRKYHGKTSLMEVGYFNCNNADTVKTLIAEEAEIDAQDWQDNTALMHFIKRGDLANTQAIIKAGAKLELKNNGGKTALATTPYTNTKHIKRTYMAKIVLNAGADINTQDKEENTPLMACLSLMDMDREDDNLVQFFIDNDADLDIQNKKGETVLMIALKQKNTRLAEQLIEKGADVTLADKKWNTARSIAKSNKDTYMVEMIEERLAQQKRSKQPKMLAM